MTTTAFQANQLRQMKQERIASDKAFAETGAKSEIGVISNYSGVYTLNTLNGENKTNWENEAFTSEIEAVKAYSKASFGGGRLNKTKKGTYLVFN